MQCAISSSLYDPYQPDRADRRSQPITIDGRQGWLIETDITVADPDLDFPGDRAIFIVVADGGLGHVLRRGADRRHPAGGGLEPDRTRPAGR